MINSNAAGRKLSLLWIVLAMAMWWHASVPAMAAGEVKEFTLVAREVQWEIAPGVVVTAMAYNGSIPGPEIRVREGDRVRVTVRNELNELTAVHWHGLDVPYDMDGLPGITQAGIEPGAEFTYEFVARPAGVRFYHSHANESVQMTNALHGAFIVEPRQPEPDGPDRHYILFLTEWAHDASGAGDSSMGHGEANYYTINGKAFPLTEDLTVAEGRGCASASSTWVCPTTRCTSTATSSKWSRLMATRSRKPCSSPATSSPCCRASHTTSSLWRITLACGRSIAMNRTT